MNNIIDVKSNNTTNSFMIINKRAEIYALMSQGVELIEQRFSELIKASKELQAELLEGSLELENEKQQISSYIEFLERMKSEGANGLLAIVMPTVTQLTSVMSNGVYGGGSEKRSGGGQEENHKQSLIEEQEIIVNLPLDEKHEEVEPEQNAKTMVNSSEQHTKQLITINYLRGFKEDEKEKLQDNAEFAYAVWQSIRVASPNVSLEKLTSLTTTHGKEVIINFRGKCYAAESIKYMLKNLSYFFR